MNVHFVYFTKTITALTWACLQRKSFTIHQKLKFKRNLSNVIMCNILKIRTLTYTLRSQTDFPRECVNTLRYGLNSLSYFAPKVWDMPQNGQTH